MPKLHEILAVESGLQATAKKINEETIRTFGKKDEHFVANVTVKTFFADEDAKLNVTEEKAMVTSVPAKLRYNAGPNVRALDAYIQKEATNQTAKADIIVGDKTLAKDVPATVLLGLETKLTELRLVYDAIPTLAPGIVWQTDGASGAGIYMSRDPVTTFSTKRIVKPVIMAVATEHHPAQVQAVQDDVPVAKIVRTDRSGMMTSADKSDLLERLDRLLRGVKRARQRANATDVVDCHIGKALFDYLHADIVA